MNSDLNIGPLTAGSQGSRAGSARVDGTTADLPVVPYLGMIIPVMGMSTSTGAVSAGLADALFTSVQQRVLGLLFSQPQRRFQSAELIRLAGSGTGATHRLLKRLAESGLVTVCAEGNQKFYQANADCPVFEDLLGLVRKTVGLPRAGRATLDGRPRRDKGLDRPALWR